MDEFENLMNSIRTYFSDLEQYEGKSLTDKKDFYAASMICFSIINETINLSEVFFVKKGLPAPAVYKEIFDVLNEKKIISNTLSLKMKSLITKRNLIAHEYGTISRQDVENFIKDIKVVKTFIKTLFENLR